MATTARASELCVMDKWYLSPAYWRSRAAEAYELAKHLDDPEAKAAMLAVAEDYERIANRYAKVTKLRPLG